MHHALNTCFWEAHDSSFVSVTSMDFSGERMRRVFSSIIIARITGFLFRFITHAHVLERSTAKLSSQSGVSSTKTMTLPADSDINASVKEQVKLLSIVAGGAIYCALADTVLEGCVDMSVTYVFTTLAERSITFEIWFVKTSTVVPSPQIRDKAMVYIAANIHRRRFAVSPAQFAISTVFTEKKIRVLSTMSSQTSVKSHSNDSNMEINGKETSDLDIITKHFKEYFIKVGPNLAKSIPNSNIDPISYTTQTNRYSMFTKSTNETEISNIIRALKNSAPGPDGIPSSILEENTAHFIQLLTHISSIFLSLKALYQTK
ncbi:hypothetical protein CAPTEDRAFT_218501 [Capitella teleta]|uniref:Uncharacterized protein n=1 Tax=Capitella teleta TaxID=283909 RepID=R7VM26_CAPTE|nr:hypothetical protein CAPTEDRAFT_218501 [Capitella teleta]|eukprot:ELU18771.1 hypothetical protein CAPTEDRAFT_218501 [Capitella teleta]